MTLVPPHAAPIGHWLHAVRSAVPVPPDVNEPAVHGSQLAAWFELHRLSAPQAVHAAASAPDEKPARHGAHDDAPPGAYVPASHASCTLVPSHAKPSGQGSQRDRVVSSPPAVKKPTGHVLQLLAPSPLYALSLPHAVQLLAPLPL